jgi:indolepyruvate ferredoxin oxidoreductase
LAEHDVKVRLEDRYTAESGQVQMTGVQALARLPLNILRSDQAGGLKTAVFISGYEGSPLGGYDLELGRHAKLLASYDLVFQPGVNEELAATSVQGTQLAAGLADARVEGVTGFWYGKSPGLDRASDALRHANLIGTHPKGGAVAFVGDDPAAKSSTVPGASEFLLADLGMPVLYPADPQTYSTWEPMPWRCRACPGSGSRSRSPRPSLTAQGPWRSAPTVSIRGCPR